MFVASEEATAGSVIENAERIYLAARHPKSFVSLGKADHLVSDPKDARFLGGVLGAESGRRYATLLQEEFLAPTGMASAVVDGAHAADFAAPHGRRGFAATKWSFDAFAPAGALRGNLRDALAFLRHAVRACRGDDATSRATCDAQQPRGFRMNATSEMGLGWVRTTRGGRTIVWHNGGTGGYSTFLGFVEGEPRGVVVLTNVGFLREIDAMAMEALALEETTTDRP